MSRTEDMKRIVNKSDIPFGLTGKLNHEEVKELVSKWFPKNIHFHEEELYHSLSLADYLKYSREHSSPVHGTNLELPLVVCKRGIHGVITRTTITDIATETNEFGEEAYEERDLLEDEKAKICSSFDDDKIFKESVFTNIADGNEIPQIQLKFASTEKDSSEDGDFQINKYPLSAMAEFRMLLETLKQNLLAHLTPEYPKEGDDANSLLKDVTRGNFIFGDSEEDFQNILKLIELYENGDIEAEDNLLSQLKDIISPVQWKWIKKTGFMECYFIFAYNDFDRYQDYGRLGNNHEGDVEGCCLVFDRSQLEPLENDSPNLDQAQPTFIITNAHTEDEQMDDIRKLETEDDFLKQKIYIAGGGHGLSFKEGESKSNFIFSRVPNVAEDVWSFRSPFSLLLALLADHFVSSVDEYSSKGVIASPDHEGSRDGQNDSIAIHTTPLSEDHHLYKYDVPNENDPAMELAERSFPGKWGRSKAPPKSSLEFWRLGDNSPGFGGKTMRFFNKLMRHPATWEF